MRKKQEARQGFALFQEEVDHRIKEAVGMLRKIFNNEEIKKLCTIFACTQGENVSEEDPLRRFENDPEVKKLCDQAKTNEKLPPHIRKNIYSIVKFATGALVLYMSLEHKLRRLDSGSNDIPAEIVNNLLFETSCASFMLVQAASEAAELPAQHGLKLWRKNPPTRNHDKSEKEDIVDEFDEYCRLHRKAPNSFENFLLYLETKGYTIYRAAGANGKGTIDKSGWRKHRSLATINSWFYELKKDHAKILCK